LVTLSYPVHKRKLLVVMANRLLPIQQHEVTLSDERLDEVLTAMGDGAIRRLLIDRGFLDGERLVRWQTGGMDVLVPVKHNMAVSADMQRLAKLPADAHFVRGERCGAKESHARPLDDVRMEEILCSLKHHWWFLNSELPALQGPSWDLRSQAASMLAETMQRRG
jgi:hypothetical protein